MQILQKKVYKSLQKFLKVYKSLDFFLLKLENKN